MPTTLDKRLLPPALGAVVGAALLGGLTGLSVLTGPLAVLLVVACTLLLPAGRTLSTRLVVLLPLISAAVFCLWLVPVAFPRAPLVAAGIGGLVGWFGVRAARRPGWLLPHVGAADVTVGFVAAAMGVQLKHLLFVPSPAAAYDYYQTQWDNSSHYFIEATMRHGGTLIRFQPPAPDGTALNFTEYPAAYHAVGEALQCLLLGRGAVTQASELVAFMNATGLLGIAGAVLVAAAVGSLPVIRANRLTAAVGPGLAGSAMVAGPGAIGLVDGHYNFPFALAMVVATGALAIAARRVWDVRRFVVIVACVVVTSGLWLPMGALAGALASGLLLPASKERWAGSRREHIVCISAAVVGIIVCLVQVAWVLTAVSSGVLLDAVGGVTRVPGAQYSLAVVALVFALVWARRSSWVEGLQPLRARHLYVGYVVGVFGLVCLAMASYQLLALGGVRYYPAKMQNGFVTLAFAYVGATVALVGAQHRGRPIARWAAALLGACAIFAHGLPHTTTLAGPELPATPSSFAATIKQRPAFAAAAEVASRVPGRQHVIVLLDSSPMQAVQDSALVASLRGTYSVGTSALLLDLVRADARDNAQLVPVLAPGLASGSTVVVASKAIADSIATSLPGLPTGAVLTI